MSSAATPPGRPDSPFPPDGRVCIGAWPVTMDDAMAHATAAGFRATPRSSRDKVVVQRDWKTAATITPTPAGVVVKRELTVAQLAMVGAVLVLLIVVLFGPGVVSL
ncbi:hypothetical protein M2302_000251 [Micromonospora sp. A200]|uniref:hypothetical protein n=1 Tax=Micromonospora sp. A200 TaxID=2940568 RepID=UPI0024766C99|nr:hypothetical protein [Micromonospora sp. A200]MDH6460100.1 hypothetical protein [Micromonospora sp. A200]